MRARVRYLHSPDFDLETFTPDDPEDVGLLIQVIAGPADGPGDESFDVVVRTPRYLARETRDRGPLMGRHYLVVDRYDFGQIRRFLIGAVESEEASTWKDLGERLGRIGKWEFEDYVPSPADLENRP